MTEHIIIRKANSDDLEGILKLVNAPHADNGKAMGIRDANTIYQSILDDPNYFQMVATDEHGIVGTITLVIIMQMTHEGTTNAMIADLVTIDHAANKEIATELIKYALNLAEEYGCYKTIYAADYQADLLNEIVREQGLIASKQCYLKIDD
jgi:N-acetylglutamate synthase-like GNAT family acetyltransferase